MRHCQPALRAIDRVSGTSGSARAHGTAIARSHGSQWVQSSKPASSSCSISRPRKPEQSMNRSPATRVPFASTTASTSPLSPFALDRDDRAFLAHDPALLGEAAKEFGIEAGVEMEGVGQGRQRCRPGGRAVISRVLCLATAT